MYILYVYTHVHVVQEVSPWTVYHLHFLSSGGNIEMQMHSICLKPLREALAGLSADTMEIVCVFPSITKGTPVGYKKNACMTTAKSFVHYHMYLPTQVS